MKDFNDLIWQRYRDNCRRLNRLEKRYFFVMTILLILILTYAQLYFRHF